VTFLGTVSEEKLQECYRQASVFLLTPQQIGLNFEGVGLVYIEAGAYGLPVVGTRVGGVPDAIRHDLTGFVFEPDDPDGIASSIVRLLTDKKLAAAMGQANRDWAETLTWERFAREQVEVYRALL
jgi:glycosyltransferase involved in cell wall biosynthesis